MQFYKTKFHGSINFLIGSARTSAIFHRPKKIQSPQVMAPIEKTIGIKIATPKNTQKRVIDQDQSLLKKNSSQINPKKISAPISVDLNPVPSQDSTTTVPLDQNSLHVSAIGNILCILKCVFFGNTGMKTKTIFNEMEFVSVFLFVGNIVIVDTPTYSVLGEVQNDRVIQFSAAKTLPPQSK